MNKTANKTQTNKATVVTLGNVHYLNIDITPVAILATDAKGAPQAWRTSRKVSANAKKHIAQFLGTTKSAAIAQQEIDHCYYSAVNLYNARNLRPCVAVNLHNA